jgi:citrate lyase beta subunit
MPQISQSNVQTLVLPKIHSHQDLDYVSDAVARSSSSRGFSQRPLQLVPSIESARGIWNLGSIAGWKSNHNPQVGGELSAILVRFLYLFIKNKLIGELGQVCSRRL